MDKNYYEILEVDRNASPEIIEKAYKTLAKKYHPDLQDEMHKKQAEETLKKINEAYETLSNPEQKALYDKKLANTTVSQDRYDEMYEQNQVLKNKLNDLQQHIRNKANDLQNGNHFNSQSNQTRYNHVQNNAYTTPKPNQQSQQQYNRNLEYEQQIKQARQQAYHDAYIQDLKNRGYKIHYKKSFSDYIKALISILLVILILFILWQIPFVKNYFIDLYNTNPVFRYICNIFINLFS